MIGIEIAGVFVQKLWLPLGTRPSRARHLVYGDDLFSDRSANMLSANANCDDGTVEQCIDELNDFFAGLTGYSPTVLAVALRVHLEALLQSLLEGQLCTREEVRELVKELEREALQYERG
jgi:hypothetical protein